MSRPNDLHPTRGGALRAFCLTLAIVAAVAPATLASAAPTTRYVDSSNPSCSNSRSVTASQHFCTISAAASKAQAGDTVLISSGTYTEDVTLPRSGSAGAPITFAPNGNAQVTVGGKANAFTISGKSYITIQGLTISGTTS